MADYKASDIAGTKWQRCYRIDLQNPSGGMPCAIFYEQEIIALGGADKVMRDVGLMQVNFDQPLKTFPMLNPMDDSVIGEGHHQDVYVLLYSLYRALADERDNPPEPPPE